MEYAQRTSLWVNISKELLQIFIQVQWKGCVCEIGWLVQLLHTCCLGGIPLIGRSKCETEMPKHPATARSARLTALHKMLIKGETHETACKMKIPCRKTRLPPLNIYLQDVTVKAGTRSRREMSCILNLFTLQLFVFSQSPTANVSPFFSLSVMIDLS